MLQVTFPEIVEVMRSAGSTVPAAEGHGCLCGALCVSDDYSLERWLEELVPAEDETTLPEDVEAPMNALYADTVQALRGDQMQFEPFLPDDAANLEQRTTALAQWCQGFLYGLGTTRMIEPGKLPSNIDEILLDFTSIGRAEVESSDSPEDDEEAYAEVVEYVRAAVQLIHDELAVIRGDGLDATPADPDADPDADPVH